MLEWSTAQMPDLAEVSGMISRLNVFKTQRRDQKTYSGARCRGGKSMKYEVLVAGMTALLISAPALAEAPTPLHPDLAVSAPATEADVVAQAYPAPPPYPPAPPPAYPTAATPPAPIPPAYPSAATPPAATPPAYPSAVTPPAATPPASSTAAAPSPPPPPQAETPPPAPSPTYVWEPGHWYWNGIQYHWQSGRYVAKPTTTATYSPGHWEQRPEGWVWVEGKWSYRTQGVGE
jgi:hypothetical protein